MADKMTVTRELKLDSYYSDNDTRMLTLDNPKTNISKSDIKTFESYCVTNQPILGDKGGAEFVRFNSAKVYERAVTKLDLEE